MAVAPTIPVSRRATATWCSARPRSLLSPRSTSPPSRPATAASSSTARTRVISPAGRCPRPATSTATASTTSSSAAYGADGPTIHGSRLGDSYVVFGHAGGFAAEIDLAAVAAGNGGFVDPWRRTRRLDPAISVASAGDINGDGFDDLDHRGPLGDAAGNTRSAAGDSYVVFGQAGGLRGRDRSRRRSPAATAASQSTAQDAVRSSGAFRCRRPATSTATASTTSSSGHIRRRPRQHDRYAGDSYVVFGHAGGFAAEIDLVAIAAGAGGFVIHRRGRGRPTAGCSVSSAGDVNGDGFDDLIVGARAWRWPGNTRTDAGDSYVVFGQAVGLCGADRPRRGRGRQWRLRHPWPGCRRSLRPFGVRGRGPQWRRLRRPHHRGI